MLDGQRTSTSEIQIPGNTCPATEHANRQEFTKFVPYTLNALCWHLSSVTCDGCISKIRILRTYLNVAEDTKKSTQLVATETAVDHKECCDDDMQRISETLMY